MHTGISVYGLIWSSVTQDHHAIVVYDVINADCCSRSGSQFWVTDIDCKHKQGDKASEKLWYV